MLCWKTIPKIQGREAAAGRNEIANTKAALVFLIETENVIEIVFSLSNFISLEQKNPEEKPITTIRMFPSPIKRYCQEALAIIDAACCDVLMIITKKISNFEIGFVIGLQSFLMFGAKK